MINVTKMTFSKGAALAALLFLSCAFSPHLYSQTSDLSELAKSREWMRLLHTQETFLGFESEVDGENFFLARDGKNNPLSELKALQKALETTDNIDDKHALCRFPARSKWLASKVGRPLKQSDFKECKEYVDFLGRMDVKAVSLVFSSYYLESPASAFGHTLLRFHRKGGDARSDSRLLDMGINYAAQVTTENALLYSIFGLTGVFKGQYAAVPYFYKVREYSDFESRDLWNYDLNLNEEQIQRMLDHLWEVGNSFSYYYYFSENCSYNLLGLLEVANFELELLKELPSAYTIPGHTVQAVYNSPGLVSRYYPDPSLRRTFDAHFQRLSVNERQMLLDSYQSRSLAALEEIGPERKGLFLDALAYYVDFLHSKEVLLGEGEIVDWKRTILVARSETDGVNRIPVSVEDDKAPHKGHGPQRAALGYNFERGETRLAYRAAYHDFMDPGVGNPEFATIEFVDFEAGIDEKGSRIHKLDLVEIMTLNPWTEYKKPMSLRAKVGFENNRVYCEDCLAANAEGGLGLSFEIPNAMFFAFANGRYLGSKSFSAPDLMEVIPELGLRARLAPNLYALISYGFHQSLSGDKNYFSLEGQLRYHFGVESSLGLEFESVDDEESALAKYYWYF